MAMDALEEGKSGLMTAINEGRYVMAPIPDPKLGHARWISHRCTISSVIARNATPRPACRSFLRGRNET
jgi:hypothetical protein